MIKVALIGAAGYTAKEFLELITRHEYLELDSIVSDSLTEGTTINSIWPRLSSRIEKKVQKKLNNKVDVALLAKSTSESQKYAAQLLAQGIRVVDLSAAFRLKDVDIYKKNLFSSINGEEKRIKLMKAIDCTNIKYGRHSLSIAQAGLKKKWNIKKQYSSKIDTACFDFLPAVRIY